MPAKYINRMNIPGWLLRNREGRSLRLHVILACILPVICTALSTAYVFSDSALQSINRDIGYNLTALSAQVTRRLEEHVTSTAASARVLANTEGLMNPETASRVVNDVRNNDPSVAWCGIMARNGTVIAGSEGILKGRNIAARPVFYEGLAGQHYGDIHDAVLLASLLPPDPMGRPTLFMDVSSPIKTADGTVSGVLAIHLDWNRTRDLVTASLGNNSISVIILSKDGTVVLGPNGTIGSNLSEMKSVSENGYHTEKWADGTTYISGTSRGGPFGWTVVLRENQTGIRNYLSQAMKSTIPSAAFITVIMIILGWFTTEHITSPLRKLSRAADKIRKGENAELRVTGSYREISVLSNSLTSLLESLKNERLMTGKARDEAETDPLTGLPNRRALAKIESDPESVGLPYAVVCMDLDGFKAVNDTYGHPAGDDLLRTVAKRLSLCLRPGDIVIRTGGDEFILILRGLTDNGAVEKVCNRVIAAVSVPVNVGEHEVRVGCSAGYALVPRDALTTDSAVEAADAALYRAKKEGRMRTCAARTDLS